jgi:hypothetical protein
MPRAFAYIAAQSLSSVIPSGGASTASPSSAEKITGRSASLLESAKYAANASADASVDPTISTSSDTRATARSKSDCDELCRTSGSER